MFTASTMRRRLSMPGLDQAGWYTFKCPPTPGTFSTGHRWYILRGHRGAQPRHPHRGEWPSSVRIADFRARFLPQLTEIFEQLLVIADEMGCLKVGEVSIDGTKIRANASKHNALSLSRANQLERRFRREAQRMLELAEAADREDQDDGFNLPEELALREDRIRAIKEAKERIRVRETERMAQERSDREAARAERKAFEAVDGRRFQRQDNGHAPKRNPNAQINLTDEDSRIMMSSEGFVQAYNGQLAVDCDSMLVAACHVTQRTTDSLQIKPMLEALTTSPIGKPTALLADAGYHSELNVERCAANDVEPYIAFGRDPHHWGDYDTGNARNRPNRTPARLRRCSIVYEHPRDARFMPSASQRWSPLSATSNEVWAFDSSRFAESKKQAVSGRSYAPAGTSGDSTRSANHRGNLCTSIVDSHRVPQARQTPSIATPVLG
ncbi:MAG: transposase [Candidatus Cybelea sp.]